MLQIAQRTRQKCVLNYDIREQKYWDVKREKGCRDKWISAIRDFEYDIVAIEYAIQ